MRKISISSAILCLCLVSLKCIGFAQTNQEGVTIFKEAQKLGKEAKSKEDLQTALNKYDHALRIFDKVGDDRAKADTLGSMGWVYSQLGKYQEALNSCEKSLSICQRIGYERGEANTLNNIGIVYRNLGRYQQEKWSQKTEQ